MDHPRRNKIICMCMIVVLVWTLILLIGPVAMKRQFVIPYTRVQPSVVATIEKDANTTNTAIYTLSNFYSDWLTKARHKKLTVRVYRALSFPADASQYAPASHYYSYSDGPDDCMYSTIYSFFSF